MKKGWKEKELIETCISIEDGDWIEKKDQSNEGVRLIQTGNIGNGVYKDKIGTAKYISEDTFVRLHCNEVLRGDILVSRLPEPLGRSCIVPALETKCITAVDCSIIRVNPKMILPQWFVYYSLSDKYQSVVNKESSGTTRSRITRKKLSKIRIPLPPLQEQKQIVEKLEITFAKIDAIKENAEKNLKEAELLFNSVLAEEIDNRGATILPLEKIVDSQSYISYGIVQPGDDQVNGVSIVRPIDLRFKTLTSIEGFKKTKQSISDAYKRSVLDGREILMCVRGTTGIVSMSSPALKGCNVTRGIVPLRIKDDIKRNYVYYALLAPCCQKYINEHTNGTALKQINIADVKTIPIAIPDSLSLQQLLVNKLNFIEERCIKLRSVCQNIAKECDALKQTILRKAFSGEL